MKIRLKLIFFLFLFSFSTHLKAQTPLADLASYNEFVKKYPNDYGVYLDRGNFYYGNKDYDAAIKDFTKAIQLKPTVPESFYNRGLSYNNKGLYDLALADFNKTIQVKPTYYAGYLMRGWVHYNKLEYDLALKDYAKALQLKPDYADVYTNRAILYMAKKQYALALLDDNKAIQLQPIYLNYLNRGNTLFELGRHEETINDYKKALELQPDGYDALFNLSAEYYNHGDHNEAIAQLSTTIQLYRDSGDANMLLILSYIANKNFDKASERYNYYTVKGMTSQINRDEYTFLVPFVEAGTKYLPGNQYKKALPLLLKSLNQYLESVTLATKFSKLDYAKVMNVTGWVYQRIDSLDKASEYYHKALAIYPWNDGWKQELSDLNSLMTKRIEQDKTPPEIELYTPKPQRGQDIDADADADNKVFVSGKAIDKSGIKWVKVNGLDVENLTAEGYFATHVKDLSNKLVIQAEDNQGNIEPGKEFKIGNVAKDQPQAAISPIPPMEKPVFHAVLIACSKYTGAGGWSELPSTIEEAKSLKSVLMNKYGFQQQNIMELYDKQREDIVTALSSKLQNMTDNDNLIILYSGHGTKEQKGSELIGYWVPLNATGPNNGYISNSTLNELIAGTKARHILIMSDACFSSAMRGNTEDVKKDEVLVPYKEEYKFESRRILTSGGLEKVPGSSTFMHMVIEALDRNTDQLLPEFYLYSLIVPGVKKETGNLPVIQSIGQDGNHGGQFYFIKQ